jgi:predicted ester cyclase
VIIKNTACRNDAEYFFGYTPIGKKAIWSEIHIIRLKAGKIIEH